MKPPGRAMEGTHLMDGKNDLKELVAALIAASIIAFTIYWLFEIFNSPNNATENQKYVLGIAVALAGTVTGYYFGRVPAEKRAETAERSEKDARKDKAQTDVKLGVARQTALNLQNTLGHGSAAVRKHAAPEAITAPVDSAEQQVAQLVQQLS
jgi:hypothetical protein